MAYKQLPDGRWIVYYRENGQVKREYFGRGPEGEAGARARDAEMGFMRRRPRLKTDSGPTFLECSQVYARAKNFNPNSRRHLQIRLDANILPAIGHRPAVRINDTDLDNYVASRRTDGVKDSTIHRELTDIKAILSFVAKRRPALIPYNPVRDYLKPRPDDVVIIPPDEKETKAILAAAAPHLQRAILLAYYLGPRPGAVELLRLTWPDVNWSGNTILIQSADKGGVRHRQVPIHPSFMKNIKQWYKADNTPDGPIVHYHGKPVKTIKTAWKKALERAKITRRLRPYDLRHKFVTEALERGEDIKAVSEIVGSSPKTLMAHYQHVSNQMREKTIFNIPALNIQNMTKKPKRKPKRLLKTGS